MSENRCWGAGAAGMMGAGKGFWGVSQKGGGIFPAVPAAPAAPLPSTATYAMASKAPVAPAPDRRSVSPVDWSGIHVGVFSGYALGQWSGTAPDYPHRSEEHTSELQSLRHLVCRLL